jgi:hypothetical protein
LDKWTSYLEDSRANPSALLESVKQLKTQDTSFLPSPEESKPVNLEFVFSKTSKESSPVKQPTESQFSSMSSEHWKKWITEQRQEYSQRKKSAHLIRENESSSWPTPTIAEVSGGMRLDQIKSGKWHNIQLREKIALMEEKKQEENWPTPTAVNRVRDEETMEKCLKFRQSHGKTSVPLYLEEKVIREPQNWATPNTMDVLPVRTPEKLAKAKKKGGCKNLREEVMQPQNWPTATTRDWKDTNATVPPSRANPSKQTLGQRVAHVGLQDQASLNTTGKNQESWSTPQARDWKGAEGRAYKGQTKDLPAQTETTGKLNPNWVEQLMGLPVGWTDLGYWETASFH